MCYMKQTVKLLLELLRILFFFLTAKTVGEIPTVIKLFIIVRILLTPWKYKEYTLLTVREQYKPENIQIYRFHQGSRGSDH
jgi:hypothetical protein